MVHFEDIEEVYKKLGGKLTPEEFRERVEKKFNEMNGLCDTKTAAMLVAS